MNDIQDKLFTCEVVDNVDRQKYLVDLSEPGPFHVFTAQELEQDPFIFDPH